MQFLARNQVDLSNIECIDYVEAFFDETGDPTDTWLFIERIIGTNHKRLLLRFRTLSLRNRRAIERLVSASRRVTIEIAPFMEWQEFASIAKPSLDGTLETYRAIEKHARVPWFWAAFCEATREYPAGDDVVGYSGRGGVLLHHSDYRFMAVIVLGLFDATSDFAGSACLLWVDLMFGLKSPGRVYIFMDPSTQSIYVCDSAAENWVKKIACVPTLVSLGVHK
jgi:hypothetical protein